MGNEADMTTSLQQWTPWHAMAESAKVAHCQRSFSSPTEVRPTLSSDFPGSSAPGPLECNTFTNKVPEHDVPNRLDPQLLSKAGEGYEGDDCESSDQ